MRASLSSRGMVRPLKASLASRRCGSELQLPECCAAKVLSFLSELLGPTLDSGSFEHHMASFRASTNGCHLPSEPAWFLLGGVVLAENGSSYHVAGLALRPALCAGKRQRPAAEPRHPERPPAEGAENSI